MHFLRYMFLFLHILSPCVLLPYHWMLEKHGSHCSPRRLRPRQLFSPRAASSLGRITHHLSAGRRAINIYLLFVSIISHNHWRPCVLRNCCPARQSETKFWGLVFLHWILVGNLFVHCTEFSMGYLGRWIILPTESPVVTVLHCRCNVMILDLIHQSHFVSCLCHTLWRIKLADTKSGVGRRGFSLVF